MLAYNFGRIFSCLLLKGRSLALVDRLPRILKSYFNRLIYLISFLGDVSQSKLHRRSLGYFLSGPLLLATARIGLVATFLSLFINDVKLRLSLCRLLHPYQLLRPHCRFIELLKQILVIFLDRGRSRLRRGRLLILLQWLHIASDEALRSLDRQLPGDQNLVKVDHLCLNGVHCFVAA